MNDRRAFGQLDPAHCSTHIVTSSTTDQPASEPIGDYAVIGDCRTAALVSRSGSMDWLCFPHFSGAAVFAAILDAREGGRFAIRPVGRFSTSRRYLGQSNTLETTFTLESGVVRVTDSMPIGGSVLSGGRQPLSPMREVLRHVHVVEGSAEVEIIFEPRPDYGRHPARLRSRGRLGWVVEHRDEWLLLRSDALLTPTSNGADLYGRINLKAGDQRFFSLAYAKGEPGVAPTLGVEALERLHGATQWWEDWSGRCTYEGPFREAVVRSALMLKLLTYAPSGAVVAAATTSLPEEVGGSMNWDYRYCWLRDAALTVSAFIQIGYGEEAHAFLGWILHATRLTWPELQVLYDIYGEAELREQTLDHLEGYRGSRPVRIGNAAHAQRQLDVYGGVVQAAYDFVRAGGRLQRAEARLLVRFGETVCRLWREPDYGIWELRGKSRHYVFSKMLCWAALDRLLDLHGRGCLIAPEARFRRERDEIRATIEARGFNRQTGSYVGVLDTTEPDAALLLMTRYGFHPASDSRVVSTYRKLKHQLGSGPALFFRFKGPDGSRPAEGTFAACAFWAIADRARRGEIEQAYRDFDTMLTYANDVGIYAEEIDPESGAALGNVPQAFTHVALIDAALALQQAQRPQQSKRERPVG